MNYIIGTKEQCEAYNEHVTEQKNYNGVTTKWAEAKKHPVEDLWSIVEEPSIPVFSEGDVAQLLIPQLDGVTVVRQLTEDWTSQTELEGVDRLIE